MGKRFINFSMIIFSFLIAFVTACPVFAFFEGSDDHEAWRDQMFGTSAEEASLPSSSQEFEQSSKEVLIDEKGMSQELKETTTASLIKAAASSPYYSLTPDQIPFYKLADVGASNVLDIIKDILANNTNYTMLINVTSDNVARIQLCEGGNLVAIGRTTSSGTSYSRVVYGSVIHVGVRYPKWFAYEYRVSTGKWYNGRNSWMSQSYFGADVGGYITGDTGFTCYSIINRAVSTTSSFRDWYFYGFQSYDYKESLSYPSTGIATLYNYNLSDVGTVVPPTPHFNLRLSYQDYLYGKASSAVSSYLTGVYLSSQDYVTLQLEKPPETYSTDHSTFQQSIQTFITKTADFNALMSQNQAALKANVKSFFDVFNSVLPTSVIIILILLIVVVVCIGVFK